MPNINKPSGEARRKFASKRVPLPRVAELPVSKNLGKMRPGKPMSAATKAKVAALRGRINSLLPGLRG